MGVAAKKSMKGLLDPEEKRALEGIYNGFRVPTDQLRRCPDVLSAIAAAFERTTSRNLPPGIMLRYMFNRRKEADWPKLGARAKKFQALLDLLPAEHLTALMKIYEEMKRPVDEFQFRPALARDLSDRFFKATGVSESGEVLSAVMTARRKRGLWPALFEEKITEQAEKPFSDIAEVQKKFKKGA